MNNGQHLAIIFNDNAGIGLHFSHIHIIDLETFEEIPVELLIENLENHWIVHEFNHNTGFIQFEGFGKKFSLNAPKDVQFFSHIVYKSSSRYEIIDDTLTCGSSL